MDFIELSRTRYSCRKFKDTPVEDSKIAGIIEAVRNAPSAVDFQPIHVWIVRSEKKREALKKCTGYHFDAPCTLMFGYKEDEAWVRKYDGKNFGDVDATIAATQAMLEIHDLGLESCWVGHFDPEAVKREFPETEGYVVTALFPFGYAADDAVPAAKHTQRKDPSELASYI